MHSVSINERVEEIRENKQDINSFVDEYKPFIASCTESVTGRYMRYGEDDELSIAMIAFVEAVNSFDKSKGGFLSFAQKVIKRRIIDYYRKEKKQNNLVVLSDYSDNYDEENNSTVNAVVEGSINKFSEAEISEYRKLELEEFKKELHEWGITFPDLVEASPKHKNTRKIYKEIIKFLTERSELIKYIQTKKCLPIIEIEKSLLIPRKKIERARKYIIAVLIILNGDYQYIRDYIDWR